MPPEDYYTGHIVENIIGFRTFRIRSKCWQYGTADTYSWAVYLDVAPENYLFSKLMHIHNSQLFTVDQWCEVDKIICNLHRGCTFFEQGPRFLTVGCDFQHYQDEIELQNRTTTTPPIAVTHTVESLIRFMHESEIKYSSILYRKFTPLCQP